MSLMRVILAVILGICLVLLGVGTYYNNIALISISVIIFIAGLVFGIRSGGRSVSDDDGEEAQSIDADDVILKPSLTAHGLTDVEVEVRKGDSRDVIPAMHLAQSALMSNAFESGLRYAEKLKKLGATDQEIREAMLSVTGKKEEKESGGTGARRRATYTPPKRGKVVNEYSEGVSSFSFNIFRKKRGEIS